MGPNSKLAKISYDIPFQGSKKNSEDRMGREWNGRTQTGHCMSNSFGNTVWGPERSILNQWPLGTFPVLS